MILTSTDSDRRILTFPAVRPCESICATTLLNSLSRLGFETLTFKNKFVSSNRRNARKTLRQVHNLLVFLDELQIESDLLPDVAITSLSELHLVFQKLKYLLEDCTRAGARVWMLMNSDRVAANFQDIIRSFSKILDGFPLGSVDLSDEVDELVNLVRKQTRKARVESDSEDTRVINSVNRILNQFENRVNPNRHEIITVLDHVGIKRWSECNEEIKFLEKEMEEEYSKEESETKKTKETNLLNGLAGFLTYCRCVVFRFMDSPSNNINNGDFDLFHGIDVDDLRCPISLEIMIDPVILPTGHTYDRSSISRWFRSGNPICPKSGEKVNHTDLVSNFSVKRVIQRYCVQNGVVLRETDQKKIREVSARTAEPVSLAATGAVKLLAGILIGDLVNGGDEVIGKAAYEVRVLTKTSVFNRSCLIKSGVVSPLLNLLRSRDPETQENAMAGLLNLSKHHRGKIEIVNLGGLGFIVEVLKYGFETEAKQHAAASLFHLASVDDNNRLIGEDPNAVSGLIDLIKSGSKRFKTRKNALIAIMSLLMNPENHWRVLAAGSVSVLLDFIRSEENSELIGDSLTILAKLAENPDGTISVILRGGLKLAVKILLSPEISPSAKQHCVTLLLNLCINGGRDVVGALVKNTAVMDSLYAVLAGGSQKTSALIKILHDFQDRKTGSGSVSSTVPSERFVHAW